jgi:hypothetical protein
LGAAAADNNVAIGFEALNDFTGNSATAIGSQAADVAGSQTNLTAVGRNALGAATAGNNRRLLKHVLEHVLVLFVRCLSTIEH